MHKRWGIFVCVAAALLLVLTGAPESAQAGKKKPFQVAPGVTFNNALGGPAARNKINRKILRAVRHARKGSTIRIMAWNLAHEGAVDALLAAHRRGVTVRVIMDSINMSRDVPNPGYRRLIRGLKKGNAGRLPAARSAAKVCHGSCRGRFGLAHSKYYLFSQTGISTSVVMEGSANLTVAGASNQWNDIFTWVNRPALYNFAVRVFDEMWRDTPVANQWTEVTDGPFTFAFGPFQGTAFHGEPVSGVLSKVVCRGALNGIGGRTVIRLFPDAMRGDYGLKVARRLKQLWDAGCNIKVGYTVLSFKAYKALKAGGGRGPVPLRHMARDVNHDGEFDKYFHLKVLTVRGVVGTNRQASVAINGSSNISGLSARSDENFGIFTYAPAVLRYQKFVDRWFDSAAKIHGPDARLAGPAEPVLLTPQGRRAAERDGYIRPGTLVVSPLTGQVVDPYAKIRAGE